MSGLQIFYFSKLLIVVLPATTTVLKIGGYTFFIVLYHIMTI